MRVPAMFVTLIFLAACSGDDPTQLERSALGADQALLKSGATGALPGIPATLAQEMEAVDDAGNGDDIVCVKTVPAGNDSAPQRTIIKDNKGGECPGGFEEQTLEGEPTPF